MIYLNLREVFSLVFGFEPGSSGELNFDSPWRHASADQYESDDEIRRSAMIKEYSHSSGNVSWYISVAGRLIASIDSAAYEDCFLTEAVLAAEMRMLLNDHFQQIANRFLDR
jgi:hypothetical protein